VEHGLALREECRLMVIENRILRRIFVPKKERVGVEEVPQGQMS
jgi:hypothetical protein